MTPGRVVGPGPAAPVDLARLEELAEKRYQFATWAPQEIEPTEAWPFQSDGAPEYQPVKRVDALVRCARCWAVVEGDVAAQSAHRIWHDALERRINRAGSQLPERYAGGFR